MTIIDKAVDEYLGVQEGLYDNDSLEYFKNFHTLMLRTMRKLEKMEKREKNIVPKFDKSNFKISVDSSSHIISYKIPMLDSDKSYSGILTWEEEEKRVKIKQSGGDGPWSKQARNGYISLEGLREGIKAYEVDALEMLWKPRMKTGTNTKYKSYGTHAHLKRKY